MEGVSDAVERIDGMTYHQVRFNVYAFGRDAKKWQRKLERARTDHTRADYRRRMEESLGYRRDNMDRLYRFSAEAVSAYMASRDTEGLGDEA